MPIIPHGNPFMPPPERWDEYVAGVWSRLTPDQRDNLVGWVDEIDWRDPYATPTVEELLGR